MFLFPRTRSLAKAERVFPFWTMTLYIPDHFAAQNREAIAELIAENPFATLISMAGSEPVITLVPFVAAEDGSLLGHVARANPHAALLGDGERATAIFHGPHAYVSPTWYEQPGVPTWNYVVASVTARVRPLQGEAAQALLDRLIDAFDPDPFGETGTRHLRADERVGMLEHIHCFALEMEKIEAKFKLSQNRSISDRQRVIAALGQQDDAQAQAVAGMMLSQLARPR